MLPYSPVRSCTAVRAETSRRTVDSRINPVQITYLFRMTLHTLHVMPRTLPVRFPYEIRSIIYIVDVTQSDYCCFASQAVNMARGRGKRSKLL